MKRSPILADSMNKTEMGQGFLAMLSAGNLRSFRENAFQKMSSQVQAVALLKDKVIPSKGIMDSLLPWINVEIMDFPFDYSHENPFPIFSGTESSLVDQNFEIVFLKAARFLQ
jgi:hypothetical protein